MDIDEIKDHDSLEAWLTEQDSYELSVTIAARAALRVQPWAWEVLAPMRSDADLTALPLFWSSTSPAVNAVYPTSDVKKAVDAAVATAAVATAAVADRATGVAPHAAAFWQDVRRDARAVLEGDGTVWRTPLWQEAPDRIAQDWETTRTAWRAAPEPWPSFARIYEDFWTGLPEDWDWEYLKQIVLIEPEAWEAGPEAVAEALEEIKNKRANATFTTFAQVLDATLSDFEFDKLRNVMRAVPVASDWAELKDPDQLRAFSQDAKDLLESLALLMAAIEAEGTALQGGGAVRTYLNAVRDALCAADEIESLRIDKLMELGRILEGMATRESLQSEFGVLSGPLTDCITKLRDLVRRHFAHVLARVMPLRDLHLEPDANYWDVFDGFREVIRDVESGADGALPALKKEDTAVLDDILDSVETKLRDLDGTEVVEHKSSLRREVDYQLAKVGATTGVYQERAKTVVNRAGTTIDGAMKWEKRVTGLGGLLERLKDGWPGAGG